MRIKDWTTRILWFVFGAVVFGLLIIIPNSYGKRAEAVLPVGLAQPSQDRLGELERRIDEMQKEIKSLQKSAHTHPRESNK